MRTAAVLFLALCLGSWAPHPLKMSTCTVRQTESGLEIKVRLFTDDFTAHLESISKKRKLNFEKPGKHERKSVEDYFARHFKLQCSEESLPYEIKNVATEEYNLVVAVTLHAQSMACSALVIQNTLMMDAFDNQKNMVIYKGIELQKLELVKGKATDTLIID